MERKIIKIDKEKCNGCGLCVNACHEGAIGLVDNKAVLLRDDYCDGLGNCLPVCPTGAISFETREAAEYNKELVENNMKNKPAFVCPSQNAKTINREKEVKTDIPQTQANNDMPSYLNQWPVQIKLVPINAPYFNNASLLIAADCTAFSYGNFHKKFMKNKITLIGCPKLDSGDYSEKLTEILKNNEIKNVTIVRMEVPCCGGMVSAFKTALSNSGKQIPWQVVTISTNGEILDD